MDLKRRPVGENCLDSAVNFMAAYNCNQLLIIYKKSHG